MSRDINWTDEDESGVEYDVRVHHFGGKFKFQFRDPQGDPNNWDYKRKPSLRDVEMLLENIRRRYQRNQVPFKQLQQVEEMLKLHPDLPKNKELNQHQDPAKKAASK